MENKFEEAVKEGNTGVRRTRILGGRGRYLVLWNAGVRRPVSALVAGTAPA